MVVEHFVRHRAHWKRRHRQRHEMELAIQQYVVRLCDNDGEASSSKVVADESWPGVGFEMDW